MKGQRTPIAILFASLVIVMLGFGIAIPLMPFYVTHFNASGSALGLMMSLFSWMQFIFAPMWGRLSDRIGRKPVLIIGIAGYAVAFFLQGIAQDIVQFTILRSVGGILSAATLPSAMAYIADKTRPEDRSRGVGLMGAAMGVGMIFGPMLGGVLTKVHLSMPPFLTGLLQTTTDAATGELINLSIPFFASALLALIALPFVMFLLPESLTPDKRKIEQVQTGSRLSQLTVGLRGPAGFLYSMAFLLAFAMAMMEGVMGLYGKEQLQMGPADIGALMGVMGVLSVIQQGIMIGPLTRRFGEERVLKGGLVISMLGFLGLALSPFKWLTITLAIVFNLGNVLLQPSVTALISRRAKGGQGAAMGMSNAFQSLGRGVGPLWAGVAYDIYPTLSFWSGALVQGIAFAFSLRLLGAAQTKTAVAQVDATESC
jgi:DHA1 family multidrug resistance protein-like MFS transporter